MTDKSLLKLVKTGKAMTSAQTEARREAALVILDLVKSIGAAQMMSLVVSSVTTWPGITAPLLHQFANQLSRLADDIERKERR